MKTLNNTLFNAKIIVIALMFSSLFNCSEDETPIEIPSISFSSTNYETVFFESGSTFTPTISWNGEKGTIALSNDIEGILLDSSTGVISWSKELPIGDNTLELIATNSAGQSSVNITIENIFQGTFKGGFNYDPDSTTLTSAPITYIFDESGKVEDTSNKDGSYLMEGNQITVTFTFKNNPSQMIIENLTLDHDNNTATLEGFWHTEVTSPSNPNGYTKLTLEK